MTIAGEDLKKGSQLWFASCGYNCDIEFAYNELEKKKSVTMTCPVCEGKTTIRRMANGKISRKWQAK